MLAAGQHYNQGASLPVGGVRKPHEVGREECTICLQPPMFCCASGGRGYLSSQEQRLLVKEAP